MSVQATAVKEAEGTLTPKRAAMLLIERWINGGQNPAMMDAADMTFWFKEDYGYTVTEKRRAEIVRHFETIIEPIRARNKQYLENAGISL